MLCLTFSMALLAELVYFLAPNSCIFYSYILYFFHIITLLPWLYLLAFVDFGLQFSFAHKIAVNITCGPRNQSSVQRSKYFPLRFPRWCTGNRDSAVWRAESRALCPCPVATDYSVRAAPPLQSARSAPNRPWNSSSLDLTTHSDHHRFQTSQSWFHRHQPWISTAIQNYVEVIL